MSTAALQAFIAKLPPMDMNWPAEMRDAWMSIAVRLLAECEAQAICHLDALAGKEG